MSGIGFLQHRLRICRTTARSADFSGLRITNAGTGSHGRGRRIIAAGLLAAIAATGASCTSDGPATETSHAAESSILDTGSPALRPSEANASIPVAASTGASDGAAEPAGAPMPNDVAKRLDMAIEAAVAEAFIPGASVGVWSPQGDYVQGFGLADKETKQAMEPSMFMRIGSETKTFLVTGVLLLVDEGKVSLDDPIGRYLAGVPNGDAITIRELAGMRTGLPDYTDNPRFWQKFYDDRSAGWRPEELLSYAFGEPLLFDPGASFNYSNTNAILLGLLIEKVTGTPLPDFIEDRVATPLKLTSTKFPRDATFATPHAQGYTSQAGAVTEIATDWNPSWAWAAGAMISNVPDLGRWAKEVATGALLSPRTQAERVAFQVSDGGRYGLGLWELEGWVGHSGFLPGYQSLTVYNAAADTTMVVLVNTDIIAAQGTKAYYPPDLIAKEIAEIMTPDHPYDPPPPPAG